MERGIHVHCSLYMYMHIPVYDSLLSGTCMRIHVNTLHITHVVYYTTLYRKERGVYIQMYTLSFCT